MSGRNGDSLGGWLWPTEWEARGEEAGVVDMPVLPVRDDCEREWE